MDPNLLKQGEIFVWTENPISARAPNLRGWLRNGDTVIHLTGWDNPNTITLHKDGMSQLAALTKRRSGMS